MISTLKIIFIAVTTLICFLMPVLLFIRVRKGEKYLTGAVVGGMLSFYLSQMIIRIPLLQLVLPKYGWYQRLAEPSSFIAFALFLGFTAGLFEESGRYFTCKLLLKKRLSYKTGLAHGIGHGGIEAILLIGINYILFFIYALLQNKGMVFTLLPSDQTTLLTNLLTQSEASMFLIAGIERALVIIIHIGISLMIVEGIVKGKEFQFFAMGILFHTILDAGVVIMQSKNVNMIWMEFYVALFAVLSIVYIITARSRFKNNISPTSDAGMQAVDEGY